MIPTVDFVSLWRALHEPVTWIVLAIAGLALLIGWRLASKTYWRVLVAVVLVVIGVTYFYDGLDSGSPPAFWAWQGALMILGAGVLLDRARRLRKLERVTGRQSGRAAK